MAEELDLYGSGIDWKKAISIFATVSMIVGVLGFFGFRWMTSLTPVTRDQALQMFKEESGQAKADEKASKDHKKDGSGATASDDNKKDSGSAGSSSGSGGGGSSPKKHTTTVAAGTESSNSKGHSTKSAKGSGSEDRTPEEGVYSWDTDGWEEASGIRRQFPEESQRIITASNGESWKQHHYFSEEREIWSEFSIGEDGAYLHMQRNRAKFGPVTNDSTIDFSPPMQVGLAEPKVGATWSGSWKGRTSGTYNSRIFDHGTISIGGETLEVWSYEVRMEMKGEMNGSVHARIMFAPKYALTVQEHYKQEIQTDGGRYRAEWDMTLKSTTPQR